MFLTVLFLFFLHFMYLVVTALFLRQPVFCSFSTRRWRHLLTRGARSRPLYGTVVTHSKLSEKKKQVNSKQKPGDELLEDYGKTVSSRWAAGSLCSTSVKME